MKLTNWLLTSALLAASVLLGAWHPVFPIAPPSDWEGAWRAEGSPQRVALWVDGYFTYTIYREDQPRFISTFGGTLSHDDQGLTGTLDFHSMDQEAVGQPFRLKVIRTGDGLEVTFPDGRKERWTRIDSAGSALSGVWRITQRENNGAMQAMPLRARRTLKILSGTRFQWVAMNVETGEFSGTGGGTYRFDQGQYTEHLHFFSRDSSRVGQDLHFEGKVAGNDWHHKGKSSKGDPIYEIWSRFGQ
jgi:hypothetical protein